MEELTLMVMTDSVQNRAPSDVPWANLMPFASGTTYIGQVAYRDGSSTDIDPRWVRVECTGEEYVPLDGTEWRDIPA